MKQQHKFSLSYYVAVFFSILLLQSIFFSGMAAKEIPYNRFRDMLKANRIQSVIVEPDRIFGLEKAPKQAGASNAGDQATKDAPDFQPQRKQAPWYLDFGLFSKQQRKAQRQFVVTRLEDPQLIPDLQAHGVDYRGKIESHWLSHFLSNWILPLVIFILLGRFLARRIGKGAGFLDVGKNKARIYAVDPSQKVTFEMVDRPDLNGRMAIFALHTRDLMIDAHVDFRKLAAETSGFAGAEIANVCNEAALLASRNGGSIITHNDFQDAIERVIAGLEKKNKLINPHERQVVAYHESGHAIVGHLTPGADPVQKVSIIPRGIGALGYTLQTPLEDRFLMSRSELLGKIKGLLGGHAAEELVFGEVSTGASNDLEKVADIARSMLTVYGMSKHMPNLSLVEKEQHPFLGRGPAKQRRSEKLEELIDSETQEIINTCYQKARQLLIGHKKELETMAGLLLKKEKLEAQEIQSILGPRALPSKEQARLAISQ